jgi:tetratricopeptide (TPR) repeat protein
MELLAKALSEVGGQAADLEAASVTEDAYKYEATNAEKWRYGAAAMQRYKQAADRYPLAASDTAADNVRLRIKDDIDYALLQSVLLNPEQNLAHLADAFATMCEKSIVQIVKIDECMAGLELAVSTAEGAANAGTRRMLAEATLVGMRTIAGESLTRSEQAREQFIDWIDRLVVTGLEPVDVAASLLAAKADYTEATAERVEPLTAAIELSPERGDLRLKLGETYSRLKFWPEALEQLRAAGLLLPPEEQEGVEKLIATADKAYQARFFPPEVKE